MDTRDWIRVRNSSPSVPARSSGCGSRLRRRRRGGYWPEVASERHRHIGQQFLSFRGRAGALDAVAFRDGTRALDASDRIIYDTTNGALLYDTDGNGAGLAVRFATLSTGLTLSEADFFVI